MRVRVPLLCLTLAAIPAFAQVASRPGSAPAVTIREHNGAPMFFIDGVPEPPVLMYQTVLTDKEPAKFRQAGYRLFSFVGNDGVFGMSIGWHEDGRVDYSECDKALKAFAERVPDGYCIPRVLVSAPPWWLDKHPDQAVGLATGVKWQDNEWGGTKHESMASELWRKEAGEALRRFLRHVLDGPYAPRVAGIHIAGGIYGEWHNWSATDLPDTSEPMRLALGRYAARKYGQDVSALRRAWSDPAVTFGTVRIPTLAEQQTTQIGMFRDPAASRKVIDYYECLHSENFEAVEHFCRIVKEESAGRLLTMALYSYVPDNDWPQAGDHRAGPRAMRSKAIDIIASPHSYGRRRLGQDGLFRNFPAAAVLHGKVFLDEGDDRTHLAPPGWPGTYAKDSKSSIEIMRREFANIVTRGVGMYYMDQSGTFFSEPALIAELARIRRLAERSMTLSRSSVAQVAVFSAMQSEFYVAGRETKRNHLTQSLHDAQIGAMCRSGAPFDWYHIEDLAEGLVRPYRTYVFLDCFYLTPGQRAAIEKLKTDGRILLWFYAPGLAAETSISLHSMRDLTGLRFEQLAEGTMQVRLEKGVFDGAPEAFGFPVTQSPAFAVEVQPGDHVWGRNPGTGKPALVARDNAGWRSVYCLTPVMPPAVLRRILRDAGVHIYCDTDDNLSANASWISLHTATPGRKTIHLPQASPVYDAIADKPVSDSTTTFSTDMQAGQTGIWIHAGPQETRDSR